MRRALVVEDEFAELTVLAMVVEGEGLHVERAENGAEALKLLETASFDLVLCDLTMPVMGGVALLEAAQRAGFLSGTRFVWMAHRYEKPSRSDVPVLRKPIQLTELRRLLSSLTDSN